MKKTIRWVQVAGVAVVTAFAAAANVAAAVSVPPHVAFDQAAEVPVSRAIERLRLERDAQLRREAQRALAQLHSEVESALAQGAGSGEGHSVNAAR